MRRLLVNSTSASNAAVFDGDRFWAFGTIIGGLGIVGISHSCVSTELQWQCERVNVLKKIVIDLKSAVSYQTYRTGSMCESELNWIAYEFRAQ